MVFLKALGELVSMMPCASTCSPGISEVPGVTPNTLASISKTIPSNADAGFGERPSIAQKLEELSSMSIPGNVKLSGS